MSLDPQHSRIERALRAFARFMHRHAQTLPTGGTIYWYHGRRWNYLAADILVAQSIRDIGYERDLASVTGRKPPRLVTNRAAFRRIVRRGRIVGCFDGLKQGSTEAACLSLWLMGRMHVMKAIPDIARFGNHQDVRVRREAARALWRLGAWSELRKMAHDPHRRVRCFAIEKVPRPHAERLERFKQSVRIAVGPNEIVKQSWFAKLPIGPGRPPKSAHLIRAILERIRRLVHGT